MLSARWRKLLGDVRVERGRMAMMIVALAVSLTAVGAVLGAWAVLSRGIRASYLGTHPAVATLELENGADAAVLAATRNDPRVSEAEARDVILSRARVGDELRPVLLFVVDDFDALEVSTFTHETGAWPPPRGTVLLERSAISMAEASVGQSLVIKTPHGEPTEVQISGTVHDPGLAPAWQEREVYAYATRETLALLGEAPVLHELRLRFRDDPETVGQAEMLAASVAKDLASAGHPVHQIRVPPPHQHPHQRQMMTILLLLLTFAGLSLVLGAVLVATSLSAMLARQVREIGVMKTVGARSGQLVRMYATLIGALGVIAFALAVPLGFGGATMFSREVSSMLNFDLADPSVPFWVFGVVAFSGILVPLAVAAIPIARAARISVRAALDEHGARAPRRVEGRAWLPVSVRNLLRRPGRLALTIGLLATGGAMFMTALAVSGSWERNLDKIYETRHYDAEIRFQSAEPAKVANSLLTVPGVKEAELWGYSPAAFARPNEIDVVRTYPDRGHGSLAVLAPPASTKLITFPVIAGRWLRADDADGVVLNHSAAAQHGGAAIGSDVLLSLDGTVTHWHVVGVVEEVGAAGVAYVTDTAFAKATSTEGRGRMVRVVTSASSPEDRASVIRSIETALARDEVSVETVVPFSELRTGVGDHIGILVRALVALATILGIVGALGLTATTSTSVIERTREIGVMKAIGATSRQIRRVIVSEALVTAAASWIIAVLLSLPLTWFVESLVGRLGFLAPLPFVLAPFAMLGWFALLYVLTLVATLAPVRRANALTVREAVEST